MNREEDHLTTEQLEGLMAIETAGELGPDEVQLRKRAELHLAHCAICQKVLAMEIEAQGSLRELARESSEPEIEQCPPFAALYELAGGLSNDDDAEVLMEHITGCGLCAPKFRQAIVDLGSQPVTEEAALISSLRTGELAWQESFAKVLAAASAQATQLQRKVPANLSFGKRIVARPLWVYAIATALILTFGLIEGGRVWRSRPQYVQGLLAQAYTERRTIELRIPGARYGPLQVMRGSQKSNLERPASLLEAEELIGREIRRQPRSTFWLEQKVRADLLDGNYDSAIESSKIALEEAPESPSVLAALGMAYYERAENNHSAVDYGQAYQQLSRSLDKHANDPVVLFNHALVSEREQLYVQALEDWKRYLSLSSDPDWRAEAQARMKAVEEKLREQKNRSQQPLDGPADFVSELSSSQQERISIIDSRADSYQVLAVAKWIPELTSGRAIDSQHRDLLEKSLRLLAEQLRLRHNDSWLTDFLSEESIFSESRGAQLLGAAIELAAHGNQESAVQVAGEAEKEFDNEHAEAGRVRAAFQRVYSNRLAAHGKACYDEAEHLVNEIRGRNYSWLEIQVSLEAAACAAEVSKIDDSIVGSQAALELARKANYGNLELRATMFAADLLPDFNTRLDFLRDGLTKFWSGTYEPMRGYSFYAALDTTAAELHLWFLDEAAIQEGLRLIENDPNKSLQGLERYRLARAQLADGKTEAAKRTVDQANALLSERLSPALYADALIDLADAFNLKGRYQDALDLLSSVEPRLQSFSHDLVLEKFYVTRSSALLGNGQEASAEQVMIQALKLAEKALFSISNEGDRLSWVQTLEPVYRSLAYLDLQKDAQNSFRAWESFKGGPLTVFEAAEKLPESTSSRQPELPSFDSWPKDRTVLLSYGVFSGGVAVWSYDGRHVQSLWLPGSSSDVESLVSRFYENCSDPRSDPATLSIEGRKLYDLLVKPIGEWIRGRSRLIIETDRSLESIAFEALVDGTGRYLGDSYEIEYSAGLFFLNDKSRSERIGRGSHALIIGQSLGDTRNFLHSLPEAADEAREIASRFADAVLLLDEGATLPRIIQELPRAEVFHFAGHAISSGQFAGLFLAPSQDKGGSPFLDARNLSRSLFRHSRLVVFSACSTANGTGQGLNNRDSLARTALAAGVTDVLASRWLVDSVATRDWMKAFYGHASNGENVSSAARQARIAVKARKEWRHPFYWASFNVFV